MFRYYDLDKNGHYKQHQFTKSEAAIMFWIFLIFGWIIPIILFIILS